MVHQVRTSKTCQHLILDTSPFIQKVRFESFAKYFYTTPEVIAEIRDKHARADLDLILVNLKVEQPTAEALKEVVTFAKKTGDFAVLSLTDLKVLALAKTISDRVASDSEILEDELVNQVNALELEETGNQTKSSSDSDSSDGEWITPTNVMRHRRQALGHTDGKDSTSAVPSVACMSSDMAVQNVALQMKIGLLSVDGIVVKQLRSWVLRCHGCYLITKDNSKKFCPRCGKATLFRCSYSIDENGRVRYHLKKNFQYNNRGSKYSMSTPKGGRNPGNIILSEDQAEFQKAQFKQRRAGEKLAKNDISLFDQDFLPGLLGQAVTGSYNRSTATYTGLGDIVVGHGRRNVNQVKKHGGKKRK